MISLPAWLRARPRERKASSVGSLIAFSNVGQPVWSPRRYDSFAREGYVENIVVNRAVSEVTRSAASVPWQLFQRRGGDREELSEHPLLSLLARPDIHPRVDDCFSCGDPLEPMGLTPVPRRCQPCRQAAWLVLEEWPLAGRG